MYTFPKEEDLAQLVSIFVHTGKLCFILLKKKRA